MCSEWLDKQSSWILVAKIINLAFRPPIPILPSLRTESWKISLWLWRISWEYFAKDYCSKIQCSQYSQRGPKFSYFAILALLLCKIFHIEQHLKIGQLYKLCEHVMWNIATIWIIIFPSNSSETTYLLTK